MPGSCLTLGGQVAAQEGSVTKEAVRPWGEAADNVMICALRIYANLRIALKATMGIIFYSYYMLAKKTCQAGAGIDAA